MIRALVFDFDGTLVDSDSIKRSAFYDVTSQVPGAAKILDIIFATADSGDRYDIFASLVTQLKLESARDWAKDYGKLCQSRILDLLNVSNIEQTLGQLKAGGYLLFIASATPQDDLISLVRSSSIAVHFAGVFGYPTAKADILHNIQQDHGWESHEIVMIGNSENDRQAAVEADCRFVGVVSGHNDDFSSRPEISLHILDELPDIIEQLNAAMSKRAYP